MSTLRPTQTLNALCRPRPDKPCIRACGRVSEPGVSYCRQCRNENRRKNKMLEKAR